MESLSIVALIMFMLCSGKVIVLHQDLTVGGNSLILMYENSQADTYNNKITNEDV